ncbi:beta-defensin 134 [Bubalus bubalis]|nr:beta-defensin 134 [Bubalus bubalis]
MVSHSRQPASDPARSLLNKKVPAMESPFTVFVFLIFWDTALAGLNPLSSELYRRCHINGTCRLECFGSEMLVAYCMFQLECCLKGNPEP